MKQQRPRFFVHAAMFFLTAASMACTSAPVVKPVRTRPPQVVVTTKQLELRESIYFETERADIKPVSYPLLDEIADVVLSHSEIEILRIEGHTDARGPADYNKNLSEQRAAAVRDYLIGRGVDPERLRSRGFGETVPLDSADGPAAWEKNRRVELFIQRRTVTSRTVLASR